jgi:hypothetical protein
MGSARDAVLYNLSEDSTGYFREPLKLLQEACSISLTAPLGKSRHI